MLIYVDFKDKALHRLLTDVTAQLQRYGFDSSCDFIPNDAIACALDDVKIIYSPELYRSTLRKLELAFAERCAQSALNAADAETLENLAAHTQA